MGRRYDLLRLQQLVVVVVVVVVVNDDHEVVVDRKCQSGARFSKNDEQRSFQSDLRWLCLQQKSKTKKTMTMKR